MRPIFRRISRGDSVPQAASAGPMRSEHKISGHPSTCGWRSTTGPRRRTLSLSSSLPFSSYLSLHLSKKKYFNISTSCPLEKISPPWSVYFFCIADTTCEWKARTNQRSDEGTEVRKASAPPLEYKSTKDVVPALMLPQRVRGRTRRGGTAAEARAPGSISSSSDARTPRTLRHVQARTPQPATLGWREGTQWRWTSARRRRPS